MLKRLDARDHDGDIVGTAAKVRKVDERLRRVVRREKLHNLPDLFVLHFAGKPVATEQKDVARSQFERSFKIDFKIFRRPEGTRDDILWNVIELSKRGVGGRIEFHLPDKTVIESELFDDAVACAIDAAVADVSDEGSFRRNGERVARRAHIVKRGVARAAFFNRFVGVEDGVAQSVSRRLIGAFQVGLGNAGRGEFTCEFAGGVRAHPVGDDEEMAATAIESRRGGRGRAV